MDRADIASQAARFNRNVSGGWQTRRWYYTPRSHRAYSVRQISPGDRRLLAEFALTMGQAVPQGEQAPLRELTEMLLDRLLSTGADLALGFAALEGTEAGDRIIGVAAYAPTSRDAAKFTVAVAPGHRNEHIGRTLLATLVRQARRAGFRTLNGDMSWANQPMQRLAQVSGFALGKVDGERTHRRLWLELK